MNPDEALSALWDEYEAAARLRRGYWPRWGLAWAVHILPVYLSTPEALLVNTLRQVRHWLLR